MKNTSRCLAALLILVMTFILVACTSKKAELIDTMEEYLNDDSQSIDQLEVVLDNITIKEFKNDDKLQNQIFELINNNFASKSDRCIELLHFLSSERYENSNLRDSFQKLLAEMEDDDLKNNLRIYEIAKDSGWYGEDYPSSINQEMINQFDVSDYTVPEIIELNKQVKKIKESLNIHLDQKNIDNTLEENADFNSKIELWGLMTSNGFYQPKIITKADIDAFTMNYSEPVFVRNGEGGFYDTHKLKEFKDEITTYGGEAGVMNTIDLSYFGDFAYSLKDFEIVDSQYRIVHKQIFDCYFKGQNMGATLEDLKDYTEYVYSPPYLFSANDSKIDVYNTENGVKVLTLQGPFLDNNEETVQDSSMVGQIINFGNYEQDNNPENGKEEIEWIVLDEEDSKLLIISKKALNRLPYHTDRHGITWENSAIRYWLNESFLYDAFSEDELKRIVTTNITPDNNPKYDTDSGNGTEDRVFLLSIQEMEGYFESEEERKCEETEYAKEQGRKTSSIPGCWYWLRTLGGHNDQAVVVTQNGTILYKGDGMNVDYIFVRPALWINQE